LGQGLATPIVAEGVETAEQLEFLTDVKCDQVQGYFIGMPEPIAHYSALVGRGHAEPRIPRARLVG
jgi:EAL domain-containing protein (putative c-di-GMP-specific phosphodiesterase class I)